MSTHQTGQLVVVVGPSGAGKDSLLKSAQTHFKSNPRIDFVRRVITRECDPATEIHDSVTEDQFKQQQAQGLFSVWWQANDLYYGLPSSVHTQIENGCVMIANGSRGALDDIRSQFPNLTTVHVTASEEILAQRLARRNRESTEAIAQRMRRNSRLAPITGSDVVIIDNSGELQIAIDRFIALIESL